jgi:hypothetical protein
LAGGQESASALGVELAWVVVRALQSAQAVGWPLVAALEWAVVLRLELMLAPVSALEQAEP